MSNQSKNLKIMIVALTVLLVIAYTFSACLPHTHTYSESGCMVCTMVEITRSMGCVLIPSAVVCSIGKLLFTLLSVRSHALMLLGGTLVGLKVKLSD